MSVTKANNHLFANSYRMNDYNGEKYIFLLKLQKTLKLERPEPDKPIRPIQNSE